MNFVKISRYKKIGFWAYMLPALDFIFNVGVVVVHSFQSYGRHWPNVVVYNEEQGIFFLLFLLCSCVGVGFAIFANITKQKGNWGLVILWILLAFFTLGFQFIKTFATFQ